MKILSVILISFMLGACASDSNEMKKSASQEGQSKPMVGAKEYCLSVGGKIKSVEASSDDFCILPGGEVVKLQEFYSNNH